MTKPPEDAFSVRRPDYIPADQEHLYPHIGGVFHDYIPEGDNALTMHGYTDDAVVTDEQRVEAKEPRKRKK